MSTLKLADSVIHTYGELPAIGEPCPDVCLTCTNLETVELSDFAGKTVVFNITPCLDTEVCFNSAVQLNAIASHHKDIIIACVSVDLPFTLEKIQQAEMPKLDNIQLLSDYKNREFGEAMGLIIADGPIGGLLARAVVVISPEQKIIYTEQVGDVTQPINLDKLSEFLQNN